MSKLKRALIVGAVSALTFYANPNYEYNDIFSPGNVMAKTNYQGGSGMVYLMSYAGLIASGMGLISALGGAPEKKKDTKTIDKVVDEAKK